MTFLPKLYPKILKICESLSTTVLCRYKSNLYSSKFSNTGDYDVIRPELVSSTLCNAPLSTYKRPCYRIMLELQPVVHRWLACFPANRDLSIHDHRVLEYTRLGYSIYARDCPMKLIFTPQVGTK